jgi:hypothetical protein
VNKDVVDLKALDEDLDAVVQGERLIASLSSAFGTLALLLATLGLYGLMSYSAGTTGRADRSGGRAQGRLSAPSPAQMDAVADMSQSPVTLPKSP